MESIYDYSFEGTDKIISPALIYYKELIEQNTKTAMEMAHGADHLWPHMKTHKMSEILLFSIELGITRFKCATIAEAEVAARCGASDVIVAYPLVGPNINRFLDLMEAFPETHFYAIGDHLPMLTQLGQQATKHNCSVDFLVDVNMGMNRTGVVMDRLEDFCRSSASIEGLTLCGLHCYDGHRNEHSYEERKAVAAPIDENLQEILHSLKDSIPSCKLMVLGGSPSFPCHTTVPDAYFSPGTVFVYDYGYLKKFPDLPYVPAATLLTRVVSNPAPGFFSIDLGYKAIAADPDGPRGLLLGVEHCEEAFQSEEHWTFRMKDGYEDQCPAVGTELFVIPTHICPTSALHASAVVVEHKKVIDHWDVTARNRKITY